MRIAGELKLRPLPKSFFFLPTDQDKVGWFIRWGADREIRTRTCTDFRSATSAYWATSAIRAVGEIRTRTAPILRGMTPASERGAHEE